MSESIDVLLGRALGESVKDLMENMGLCTEEVELDERELESFMI
jgi:hypothetical protein